MIALQRTLALAVLGLAGAAPAQAVVVYDGAGHIAGLTDVMIRDANGHRRYFDVRFVHASYLEAYPGAGYTWLPAGWAFDHPGSLRAWAGLIDALGEQGAALVPFAGGQTAAYLPWLATGIQSGYPCHICLRTSYGFRALSSGDWAFGGLKWVSTYASGSRVPAGTVGPVVTWVDLVPQAAVPEPGAAWLWAAGLGGLAWRLRRRATAGSDCTPVAGGRGGPGGRAASA